MIALDVHVIGEQETGNEKYTLSLTRALLAAAPDRLFGLFTPRPECLPADMRSAPNARVITVKPRNHLLRVPVIFPYTLARAGARLVHVNYNLPPVCPCPGVVTIHDLSYVLFPQDAPPRDRLVLGLLLPRSARQAAAIIAVSENTRRDIVRCLRVPEERITVIHEAAPDHVRVPPDAETMARVAQKYGLQHGYVLAVGNLQPRKNLLRLIEAFIVLRREGVASQLVIVGRARWRGEAVVDLVRRRGIAQDVVIAGYVPDEDLAPIYRLAALLVYPSLYEGFGLPVLEAMTCGTPVVAGNASSLPEVAGDAALLVDPYDVGAIAEAMRAVLTRPDLAVDLRQRGLRQAARFSWQKAAQETLAVYDRVLSQRANGNCVS